jgi:hypothetical protein
MRQTIFILTILLFSFVTYGQRDTVIISKNKVDTTVLRKYKFNIHNSPNNATTTWTFNQTWAKSCGLHLDSLTASKCDDVKLNDFRSDSIISIINSDTSLTIKVIIIADEQWGNFYSCGILMRDSGVLNLSYANLHLARNAMPYFYFSTCVTFVFTKTKYKDINAIIFNDNRETIKRIKK